MSLTGRGRYSKYLRPISILFDLLIISTVYHFFLYELNVNYLHFTAYQILSWCIIAYFLGFYEIYRYTTVVQILSKLFKQGLLFLLVVIAFFPFAKQTIFSGQRIAEYMVVAFVAITSFKFLLFYYLKKYRINTGSNRRNAIIVGYTPQAINLKKLFDSRADYGYNFHGYFSDKKKNPEVMGGIADIKNFTLNNNIDDIYCSLNELTNIQMKDLVAFAEENDKVIKFIPDTKNIFSKNLRIDYYEVFPVLSLRKTPIHEPLAHIIKRAFDIGFSLFVIIFILSWLTP